MQSIVSNGYNDYNIVAHCYANYSVVWFWEPNHQTGIVAQALPSENDFKDHKEIRTGIQNDMVDGWGVWSVM